MHKKWALHKLLIPTKVLSLSAVLLKLSGNDAIRGISGHATVVILAAHENVAVHPPDGWPGVLDDVIVFAVHGAITHGQHLVVQVIRGVTYGGRERERDGHTFKRLYTDIWVLWWRKWLWQKGHTSNLTCCDCIILPYLKCCIDKILLQALWDSPRCYKVYTALNTYMCTCILHFTLVSVVTGGYDILTVSCRFCFIYRQEV